MHQRGAKRLRSPEAVRGHATERVRGRARAERATGAHRACAKKPQDRQAQQGVVQRCRAAGQRRRAPTRRMRRLRSPAAVHGHAVGWGQGRVHEAQVADVQRAWAHRTTGLAGSARRLIKATRCEASLKHANAAQGRPRLPAAVHGHAAGLVQGCKRVVQAADAQRVYAQGTAGLADAARRCVKETSC